MLVYMHVKFEAVPVVKIRIMVFWDVTSCSLVDNNNNIYLLQLGCYPVAVVILHVNKTLNWLLLNLSREGYIRSM